MNISPLESLTKEELIELIKHERDHIAGTGKMTPTVKESLTVESTDSEMLDWLRLSGSRIERRAISTGKVEYRVIDVFGDIESTSETAREAIKKAMRGEE